MKETLEEFSQRVANTITTDTYYNPKLKEAIEIGANWQSERMYSEEEVKQYFYDGYYKGYNVGQNDSQSHPLALTIANHIHNDFAEYFSQFKK